MVLMAGIELPIKAIREQIASALDIIVHQSRFKDGSRRITHVTEVQGMEGDVITLQDIFIFQQDGIDETGKVLGHFRGTGILPRCFERFSAFGVDVSSSLFE
jgi:pilus assembly protein CpaF